MVFLPTDPVSAGALHTPDHPGAGVAARALAADVPHAPEARRAIWYTIYAGQTAFVPPDHVYHSFSAFRRDTSRDSLRAPLHPCSSMLTQTDPPTGLLCRSERPLFACTIRWVPASSGVQKRLHPAPRGAGSVPDTALALHPRAEGSA